MTESEKARVSAAFNGVPMQGDAAFSPEVNERLATAEQNARQVFQTIESPWPAVHRLITTAHSAQNNRKRVFWLNKAADALLNTYGPLSACKTGCAHCCHIPVEINKAEADAIGKAIGRKPTPKADHLEKTGPEFEPCTFLEDNQCAIYKDRPSVCRSHINMDKDDLLCRLVPGAAIPVPYLDTRPLIMARAIIGGHTELADIRQWFPK